MKRLRPSWQANECPDPIARAVINYHLQRYSGYQFSIPALSKTANKATRFGNGRAFPHPDLAVIKRMVKRAIENDQTPAYLAKIMTRRFSVVAVFESQRWVTKKGLPCQNRDVDNRVKTLLDAAVQACLPYDQDCNDANAWQIHAFKLQSVEERSTLFIFDLSREPIPAVGDPNGTLPGVG